MVMSGGDEKVFCVSAVRGDNIDKVKYFLAQLLPRSPWKQCVEQYVEYPVG